MDTPHPECHRDSYAMTDHESVHSEPKQTTGPEFYARSNISCRVGLAGVAITALFGVSCICTGVVISLSPSLTPFGLATISFGNSTVGKELFSLSLTLVVTACTEATGFVHGIALRSALASERRLCFHANLRLVSAASGVSNPNGTLCNIMMAILLIASYTSSLLLTVSTIDLPGVAVGVHPVPLLVIGVALFLQAVIAFASVRTATILTWSSSPFDTAAALVHHAQIFPELGRCMHGVADDKQREPVKPHAKQSSAWDAHLGVQKVVLTLWLLVIIYVAWGIIIFVFPSGTYFHPFAWKQSAGMWSFLPQEDSPALGYEIPLVGSRYWYCWILYYANMAAIQGPLTLALHCSELAVNLIRDECAWRKATTKKGTTISSHPLASVLGSPLSVALLASKPLLHWMLGLAFDVWEGTGTYGSLTILVNMLPFQIFNYSAALFIFSLALTVTVLHRPNGPQPAAYGHIQTLANLIDEWSPTMWWGHKYAGHAGTSNVRLGEVDMDEFYG